MRRVKTTLLAILAVLGAVVLFGPLSPWSAVKPALGEGALSLLKRFELPSTKAADETAGDRVEKRVMEMVGARCSEGVIRNGETLETILRRSGASANEAFAFVTEMRKVFDPRKVKPGDTYRMYLDGDGELLKFSYRRSPVEIYEARREGKSWATSKVNVPIEKRQASIAGVLESSLWESFVRAGADADLIMGFADLFSWDVDFAHDSQQGDEFRVIYEVLYADGQPIGNGRILAASYKDHDHNHTAFYYDNGDSKGYYDLAGNSTKKTFLRAPLSFLRISSNFSYARLHPVTHVVKPHLGVDFAAPIGTPVWAVADGTVIAMGNHDGGGNTIAIRHAMSYETYYLHLDHYGRNVRPGARVEQGQVIGYVGMTGMATGPHLDYRVKKNGQWINPLKEKFTPGEPIPKAKFSDFKSWAQNWLEKLDGLPLRLEIAGS